MSRTLAAVDLGAQSGRVAVGRFDGDRLAIEEVHRFANVPVENDGVLEWDAARLRKDVEEGLRRAGRDAEIDSLAVDSWAVDFGLLDAAGRLIRNPVHYRDRRRLAAVDAVLERIPARELYERTAIQLLPINTIFELAAMVTEGDGALAEARRLLMIPDLFHHWLCGSETTELTNASTTQCYDPHRGEWALDLLERLGVPAGILPDVVSPGTRLGAVGGPETGVEGAAVVATATHDTGAAVAGAPLTGERSVYLSVGTWSLVGIESDAPTVTDAAYSANLTNESGVDGTFRTLRNITGLWLLHECRRAWSEAGRDYDFRELVELARSAPARGSLIDANATSFVEPGDMPQRIARYCAETGQDVPRDDGAFVRCILESIALKHAESVELLARVTGRELEHLHVLGGGANNDLLCAWTAQAAQRPVIAGPVEATLVGNLLVQALALGEISSLAEGREVVRRSFVLDTYEPTVDSRWDEARSRFAALSGAGSDLEMCA
ncbi:MAG: rhamnulokinase family protein [Gaiellaceae bacterium]